MIAFSVVIEVVIEVPARVVTVSGNTPWAIVLCKFSDVSAEPQQPSFFEDMFTESGVGKGGLFDYWQDMSYGNVNLAGSHVFGWSTMPLSLYWASGQAIADIGGNRAKPVPMGRFALIKACIDNADASVYYPSYYGGVSVLNASIDMGSVGHGDVSLDLDGCTKSYALVLLDVGSINPSAAEHEMGHGYGLEHSFDRKWSSMTRVLV